ncbi:MAG: hypothetical protein RL618_653 [Pseudomonadota bacterium]
MKRLSTALSLLLFLALCASLAYWLLQWLAPVPRPVVAPPAEQWTMPPLSAAYALFGGNPHGGGATIQLRGIIHADRSAESVAIMAVEGKPSGTFQVSSEVTPGIQLKEIRARTVILSERGADIEVILPDFSTLAAPAQSASDANALPSVATQPPASSMTPQLPAESPQAVQGGTRGTNASGPGNMGNSAEGTENTANVQSASPAMRPSR